MSKVQKPGTQDDWDAAAWASAQVRASSQPAAIVSADGTIIGSNQPLDALLVSGRLVSALQAAVVESSLSQRTVAARISTRAERGDDLARRFDVTLVPVEAANTLLIAAFGPHEWHVVDAVTPHRGLAVAVTELITAKDTSTISGDIAC